MNLQRGDRKPVIHRIIAVSWFFFCLTAGTVLISFAFQAERTWTETLFPCYLAVWALIFFSGRLLLGRLLKAALVKCNRTEEGRLAEAPKRAGATLNWAKDRSLSPLFMQRTQVKKSPRIEMLFMGAPLRRIT